MTTYLYHQLEQQLRLKISSGQLAAQSKLPSIRVMCLEAEVSKSTVITAYSRLEAEGLIEARSKSGYYVCAKGRQSEHQLKTPATSNPASAPKLISRTQVMLDLMKRGAAFDLLSSSQPDPHNIFLRRCLSKRCAVKVVMNNTITTSLKETSFLEYNWQKSSIKGVETSPVIKLLSLTAANIHY